MLQEDLALPGAALARRRGCEGWGRTRLGRAWNGVSWEEVVAGAETRVGWTG